MSSPRRPLSRPKLFVGSSTAGRETVVRLAGELRDVADITAWCDGSAGRDPHPPDFDAAAFALCGAPEEADAPASTRPCCWAKTVSAPLNTARNAIAAHAYSRGEFPMVIVVLPGSGLGGVWERKGQDYPGIRAAQKSRA